MAATARLIVLMEEDQKAELESQARAAKVSTAEFVRRRLFGRGEPEEEAFIQTLAELRPMVEGACETIDTDLAEIRALREDRLGRDRNAAERARHELTPGELASVANRLRIAPSKPSGAKHRGEDA